MWTTCRHFRSIESISFYYLLNAITRIETESHSFHKYVQFWYQDYRVISIICQHWICIMQCVFLKLSAKLISHCFDLCSNGLRSSKIIAKFFAKVGRNRFYCLFYRQANKKDFRAVIYPQTWWKAVFSWKFFSFRISIWNRFCKHKTFTIS